MTIEVDGLISYMANSKTPYVVTDINTPGVHAPGSYHYAQGTPSASGTISLAVDLAGPTPSRDSPQLLAVYKTLEPLGPVCLELIYAGNQWKNGRRVAQYDFADNIHTHVHIAVPRGWAWAPPAQQQPLREKPMYVPPLGPIAAVWQNPDGSVIAAVAPDGSVFAWGCPYYGGANGQPYFANREAALIGARDDAKPGYQITATSGEKYRYGP